MWRRAGIVACLLAGCVGAPPPTTGRPALAPAPTAELKTKALHGALDEIARGRSIPRDGVYLDTLVGPTPDEFLYTWSHPREWLDAMVATKLVDGTFGVPTLRTGLGFVAAAVEIGEPYPVGRETLAIGYAWCLRPFPTVKGRAAPASVWIDAFVRADTGWIRVRHTPATAISACTP
jgi:hypothetical protein